MRGSQVRALRRFASQLQHVVTCAAPSTMYQCNGIGQIGVDILIFTDLRFAFDNFTGMMNLIDDVKNLIWLRCSVNEMYDGCSVFCQCLIIKEDSVRPCVLFSIPTLFSCQLQALTMFVSRCAAIQQIIISSILLASPHNPQLCLCLQATNTALNFSNV